MHASVLAYASVLADKQALCVKACCMVKTSVLCYIAQEACAITLKLKQLDNAVILPPLSHPMVPK